MKYFATLLLSLWLSPTLDGQTREPVFDDRPLSTAEQLSLTVSKHTDQWGKTRPTLVLIRKPPRGGQWHAVGVEGSEELFAHWRPIAWDLLSIDPNTLSGEQRHKLTVAIDLTVARFVRDFEELQRRLQRSVKDDKVPEKIVSDPRFNRLDHQCRNGLFDEDSLAAKVLRQLAKAR